MKQDYDFLDDVYTTIAAKYQELETLGDSSDEDKPVDNLMEIRLSMEYLMEFIETSSEYVDITKVELGPYMSTFQFILRNFENMIILFEIIEEEIGPEGFDISMEDLDETEQTARMNIISDFSEEYTKMYFNDRSFSEEDIKKYLSTTYLLIHFCIIILLHLEIEFVKFFEG